MLIGISLENIQLLYVEFATISLFFYNFALFEAKRLRPNFSNSFNVDVVELCVLQEVLFSSFKFYKLPNSFLKISKNLPENLSVVSSFI